MDIHTLPHWSFGDNPQMADDKMWLIFEEFTVVKIL